MIRTLDTHSHRTTQDVAACAASLFALELLQPSRTLYLCAPALVDSPVLDNDRMQYAALLPHLPPTRIGLAALLQHLAERGVAVRLIVPHPRSDTPSVPSDWAWADVRHADPLYQRGLFTDYACLRGDLRSTHNGLTAWEGNLELLTDDDAILPCLAVQRYWEELA